MVATIPCRRFFKFSLILVAAICFASISKIAFAQKQPESQTGPSVAWQPLARGNPDDYTGSDRCKSCHKAEFTEFAKTHHANLALPGAKSITGCEACHGPGKAHVDAMENAEGDDAKIATGLKQFPMFVFKASQKENAERCLT